MGEEGGRRPAGFDFANSPTELAAADVDGRVIVQRTSAGTQGVVAARSATRLWCAALVTASATAAVVRAAGMGAPTYVITGWAGRAPGSGLDDLATAELIERARRGLPLDTERTARSVATSDEAIRTLGGFADNPTVVYELCNLVRNPKYADYLRLEAVISLGPP